MKHIKLYEDFTNEATTSWKKMMQGVRASETGPWSIVAIQDRKVVGQSIDIRIQDLIPAKYEALKKEFPKAKLHIEDGTGMVVWNEGIERLHDAVARYKNNLNEAKFKVGDKWEWHHVDGVKTVEITNVKSNGDVVGREDGSSEDFIVRDANKYLKKKVNEASTWKTRDGLGINNITGKSINPEVKKIIKSKNTLDGKEGKILVDTEGNIAFFENPTVAQEVADLVGGTIVNKIETKDGLTHSASSRGGSMVILESTINEAKNLTREELVKILQTKYALNFTKNSEEFDGEEGGIWLGGSEGKVMPDGKTEMFNYYHGGSKFPQGINKDFANFLAKRGWYGQFADPGTVLLWPSGSNESIDITHTKDSDTLVGNPGEDDRMLNVRAFRGTVADLTSFVNDKIGK